MDRLEGIHEQIMDGDVVDIKGVLHKIVDELRELRDTQEPSRYNPEQFDWSQAKPGMGFWVATITDGPVYFLSAHPYLKHIAIVSWSDCCELYELRVYRKDRLTRAPEHDLDWSHICTTTT